MARKQRIAHQQRWPVLEVPTFYAQGTGALHTVFEVHHQLGSQGLTEDDLLTYQRQILNDIEKTVGHPRSNGFNTLLDPGRINFTELQEKNSFRFNKPKVSLRCFLTSKNNLSVTWHPYKMDLNFNKILAPEWLMTPFGHNYFDRPDDELMFIRDFGELRSISDKFRANSISVDLCLLHMGIKTWNDLKAFVSWHFDVQVIEEPSVTVRDRRELGLESKTDSFGGSNDIAVGFEVVNTLDAERNRLESLPFSFSSKYGISVEDFWETIQLHRYDHGGLHSERASRAFRKMGADKLAPGVVAKLEKDFLSAIEARVWGSDKTVVQFPKASE